MSKPSPESRGGHLLVLNAGSSSLKFALYEAAHAPLEVLHGQIEGLATYPRLVVRWSPRLRDTNANAEHQWKPDDTDAPRTIDAALAVVMTWLRANVTPLEVRAVGHRVVHGGVGYAAPVRVDDSVLAELETLVPLAPLHEPHNLEGVRRARAHFPGVPQVACFDTAFHRGHAFAEETYALPRKYHDAGVRRYGFHGLSYEYVSGRLAELSPKAAAGRVIVAHLGSGASACAIRGGASVASTMGFTALDGLVMGTRCGQLDPGVLLWLMTERQMDADAISQLLYTRSGLKGVSGISNDMRELRASDSPTAREAIEVFNARLLREIGALTAVLQGLDALVFTAGIGENDSALRGEVCERLGWLGVQIDPEANATHGRGQDGRISTADSKVEVRVIRTDEEIVIARQLAALLV